MCDCIELNDRTTRLESQMLGLPEMVIKLTKAINVSTDAIISIQEFLLKKE